MRCINFLLTYKVTKVTKFVVDRISALHFEVISSVHTEVCCVDLQCVSCTTRAQISIQTLPRYADSSASICAS